MPPSILLPPRIGLSSLSNSPRVYQTSFGGGSESPVSENGSWQNNGIDWTTVNESGGVAFGTQAGGGFDDSYAHLTGFAPDQEIIATVFKGTTSGIQEVELLLRCSSSAHVTNTYEINFAHDGQYCDFVQWPGPIGTQTSDFRFLVPSLTYSIPGGMNDGDRIRARIQGNVLNAWIDHGAGWIAINSAPVVDTAGAGGTANLKTGNPGMGFFKTSGSGAMANYCFTDYRATSL